MNEQYDMLAFDAMVARSKADLTSHYRRNVHDGMLHGWIEGVKNERRKSVTEIERLRDLLAKSIRREEIIEAENERFRRALETISIVEELHGHPSDALSLCCDVAAEALKGEK